MGRVIIFDVWSHFAYFRKHYTTTTASTHPFIPRSAVEGLVGAIIGLRSEEFPEMLWDANIAVELRKPEDAVSKVIKIPFGVTYTHSDFWAKQVGRYLKGDDESLIYVRAPRSIEILKEPRYRIYFMTEHPQVYSQLLQNLIAHRTHFTPYLGSSNMLANFRFIGEGEVIFEAQDSDQYVRVSSIIPYFDRMPRPKVEPGSQFAIEQNIPLHLNKERKATGYYSALYSPVFGQTILVANTAYTIIRAGGEEINVTFIPTSPRSAQAQ